MTLDESRKSIDAQGQRIALLRERILKITQQDFAKKIPVSRNTLNCWENGNISRPIQARNMQNLIKAFSQNGIRVSERWIRTGEGPAPDFNGASVDLQNVLLTFAHANQTVAPTSHQEVTETTFGNQLATSLFNEMKLFTDTFKQAVLAKLNHSGLAPYYEKGDWLGGLWQDSITVVDGLVYIIPLGHEQLHVAQLSKASQEGYFKLSYHSNDDSLSKSIPSNPVFLEKVALVIRFWR